MSFGGLPSGSATPVFEAVDSSGKTISSHDLIPPYVLVFVSESCGPCRTLVEDVQLQDDSLAPDLPVPIVFVFNAGESADDLDGVSNAVVIYQEKRRVADAFQSAATPHGFAIDGRGTVVSSGHPNTVDDLRALAASATAAADVPVILGRASFEGR